MLDRTDFASWQQRIRLYCRGKENRVNILNSIDEGPYHMGTVRETLAESTEGTPQYGPKRPRAYSDLTSDEKDRFAKLINDMRNIKMTMSRLQLNSKFVNNMLPEWGRFVTDVKLNRGLRDSNYDQLYAYLKQHETHAKENKMMLERISQPTVDPLALLSNVFNPQHYSPSSSASSSTQVPQPLGDSSSSAEDLIKNLTNTGQGMNPQGGSAVGYEGAQNRVGNVKPGQARPGQARHVKCYNCNGTRERSSFGHRAVPADDCDAFDSDVDEASTAQTMFMANLSSANSITDEARPSYDFDILSESDYLDEFYGPFIPIHILEEERTRREHADYINRMEMFFTINLHPHNPTNDNTNIESFSSFPIPSQENDPRQEEIDVVSITNDVLHPSVDNVDSDEEVDAFDVLRVDNFIQNSEHEYSESEDSNFDNPPLPLPPPKPPDIEFDFEINLGNEISVERSVIVKFECINARVKFDVFNDENDVLSYFMFVIFAKEFSLLSTESKDTIFDPGISD
nr:hypothetical protein [Tanacetum cinerariifolium]